MAAMSAANPGSTSFPSGAGGSSAPGIRRANRSPCGSGTMPVMKIGSVVNLIALPLPDSL